jgi:hypothetical protein
LITGKRYNPSWTRLASSAIPGSDRVILQQNVNWEAGQQVVLVTSYMHDDFYDMNEVLTVRAVSGKIVQFTTNIRFYHHAGAEYQTEVGLLSRRIQFSGDQASENEKFGGHVMMMGEGRVSGVETNRMGQFNVLGRYPVSILFLSFFIYLATKYDYLEFVLIFYTIDSFPFDEKSADVICH